MFLQIHTLTSYPASLLNRDDAGLAKRIPFGNATRLRVSSQCLKRHWRERLRLDIDLPRADQTRKFFAKIEERLRGENKLPENLATALSNELMKLLLSKSEESEEGTSDNSSELPSGVTMEQPSIFGRPEQDYLVKIAADSAQADGAFLSVNEAVNRLWEALTGKQKPKKSKKRQESEKARLKENFKAMLRDAGFGNLFAGLEGALFGRFVTSDILSRSDAPVHVAHSFSVHALDTEVDYFTAIEELAEVGETGAAHAGDMELGSGLFYSYVAVDLPLLLSNLTGCDAKAWAEQDPQDARKVLRALILAIATISPGAKLGSTAPYAYSDFVLLETGKQQPRTLANSYLEALLLKGDAMQAAVEKLASHVKALDRMYGKTADFRAAATTQNLEQEVAKSYPLNEAIDLALKSVFGEHGHENANSPV